MHAARKLKGLFTLATDAVDQGSRAVERVHRATADRPFRVLAELPAPIAVPARGVKLAHDVGVAAVYGSIRIVNHAVAAVVDVTFDLAFSIVSPQSDDAAASESPAS